MNMKKNKLPSLIVLMILTVLTVSFWILFTVYRSYTLGASVTVSDEITKPLTPKLDTETIELIKNRLYPL